MKTTKVADDGLLEGKKRAPIHQPRNNICFDASNNDANNARENKLKTKKNNLQRIVDYALFLLTFHRCLLPVLRTKLLYFLSDKILLN